jgi:hypothetical protein
VPYIFSRLQQLFVVFFLFALSLPVIADELVIIDFDEGQGSSAADSSSFQNHATLLDNSTWVPSERGFSLRLDGEGDVAVISETSELNITDEFTVSVRIKSTEDRLSLSTRQR